MKFRWNKAAERAIHQKLAGNLDDGAMLLVEAIRAEIDIQGPPRSLPGDPPHMDSQALYDSYDHATDKRSLVAHVGSDVPQSVYMELGTNTVAPRPHVIPTLLSQGDVIAREICKP